MCGSLVTRLVINRFEYTLNDMTYIIYYLFIRYYFNRQVFFLHAYYVQFLINLIDDSKLNIILYCKINIEKHMIKYKYSVI